MKRLPQLLLATLLLMAAAAAFASDRSAFAGTWTLDNERSESPERANRRTLRALDRALQDERDASTDSLLAPLRQPAERLRLELSENTVTITTSGDATDSSRQERHYTDGRAATVDSSSRAQSIAGWEDGSLYIEKVSLQGTRVLEVWSLQRDALHVQVEARNPLFEDPIGYRLVYTATAEAL